MSKTVLELRMDALARHLDEAKDPYGWIGQLSLDTLPEGNLWITAVKAIQDEAEAQRLLLQQERDSLANGSHSKHDAWRTYGAVRRKSDEIFREFLDLLGGLALRDRIRDEYVCRFADELIRECAAVVGRVSSFAIPAFEDALPSTLRRAARVRFPDWHLWTLPLVAYEYSHIAMRETNFRAFAAELADEDSRSDVDKLIDNATTSVTETVNSEQVRDMAVATLDQARSQPSTAHDELSQLAQLLQRAGEQTAADMVDASARAAPEYWELALRRAEVLLADAFATFTTGPAYACAELVLRLDPAAPAQPERPPDSDRAAMILAILQQMGDPGGPPPFAEFGQKLQGYWQAALEGVDPDGRTRRSLDPPLDAGRVLTRFRQGVIRPRQAEYSKSDWQLAQQLGDSWLSALQRQRELALPADPGAYRLRDALNAAWHSRLDVMQRNPDEDHDPAAAQIEKATRQLCDEILARHSPGLGGGPPHGGLALRPH